MVGKKKEKKEDTFLSDQSHLFWVTVFASFLPYIFRITSFWFSTRQLNAAISELDLFLGSIAMLIAALIDSENVKPESNIGAKKKLHRNIIVFIIAIILVLIQSNIVEALTKDYEKHKTELLIKNNAYNENYEELDGKKSYDEKLEIIEKNIKSQESNKLMLFILSIISVIFSIRLTAKIILRKL